jgi:hypothetical protein
MRRVDLKKQRLYYYKITVLNFRIFITQMECAYCAVRTEYLNIIQAYLIPQMFNTDIYTKPVA